MADIYYVLDVQVQRGIFNVIEREKQREEDVWIWKSYINRIVRLEVYNCWAYEQNHLETLQEQSISLPPSYW